MYSEVKTLSKMVERRRDFHRYPETGWAEFRTTSKIAETLAAAGMDVRLAGDFVDPGYVMGRAADTEAQTERALRQGASPEITEKMKGLTGLLAEIDTGMPGPLTAIRFDIDSVDTTETEDPEHLPVICGFRSVNNGSMHACAHDGHAAVGMTLAEVISAEKDSLKGKIRFIFQPAEEGARGGYAFLKAGAVDDADYFLTLHLGLGNPTGTVFGGTDGFLFSTKIDADYKGVGAHAGAEPQKGKNALLAAASAALSIHGIPPSSEGLVRTNVGVLNAGDGRNVVPPKAHMKIETRGATEDAAMYIYMAVMRILSGAAEMYDVKLTARKCGEAISASSDRDLAGIVMDAAASVSGVSRRELIQPMAGSDDACWLMKCVQKRGGKATYIGIGADTKAGHHNDHFDFDEQAMGIALGVLYHTVFKLNGQ
jgi:aminobenzoyl-glutamate utilization protein A